MKQLHEHVIENKLRGTSEPDRCCASCLSVSVAFHCKAQLVKRLQVEPIFRARPEPVTEAQRGVCGDAALAVDDSCHAVHRNLDLARQLGGRDSELLQFFGEVLEIGS